MGTTEQAVIAFQQECSRMCIWIEDDYTWENNENALLVGRNPNRARSDTRDCVRHSVCDLLGEDETRGRTVIGPADWIEEETTRA
jgi:hypothetical protein